MEYLVKSFHRNFSAFSDEIVDFQKLNAFDLLVTLKDGTRILYDDFEKTARILRNEGESTELECRKKFGEKLSKLLSRKGMTQKELAEMIDVKPAQLNRYILGYTTPGFYIVSKIAKALDCSIDEFTYY